MRPRKSSFEIYPGETLALVGESGSGKSTIGKTLQQLLEPTSGTVRYSGQDIFAMDAAGRQRLRQQIQYIFQDPFAALDPRKPVAFSIAEPIRTHRLLAGSAAIDRRVAELLEQVGLKPEHAARYPHEFSGGQRQRVCIARALASNPQLIIADESVSALDVSIQAQILNLMMDLQRERGLSYLFITHDMAVVEQDQPSRGGAVPGPDRRDRHAPADFRVAAACLHAQAAVGDSGGRAGAGDRHDAAAGRDSKPGAPGR